MSGLLCAGDLYVDRFDDQGNSTGLKRIGNATQFQLQEASELRERISKGRDTYGQSLDSVYVKQPAQMQMTLDEVDKDNLAMALLGTTAAVSVASGSVTDESVTLKHDQWVELANRNITDGTFVLSASGGTPTYEEGTDYELNRQLGMVKALSGGATTDGEDATADYDHGGVQGSTVAGGAKPTIRGRILLDGKNLANGDMIVVDVFDTTLTPTSAVDFLADEFVPLQMDGRPKTPTGKASPYDVQVLQPGSGS